MRPLLRLLIRRTESNGSRVGPALTSTRLPRQSERSFPSLSACSIVLAAASTMHSGSAIRPVPTRSHASSPACGARGNTRGSSWSLLQLR